MPAAVVARAIFELAGVTSHYREGVGNLTLRLFGPRGLGWEPDQAEPVRLEYSPPRIVLRSDLTKQEVTMAICRALATWWAARNDLPADVPVDLLALEIAVPEASLQEALAAIGFDVDDLADEFVCPREVVVRQLRARRMTRSKSGTRERLEVAS